MPPTITFTVPNHHTLDIPFSVSASSNSAGSITYSVVSGPATMVGSTVTLTGVAGTVVLQTSQSASGLYTAGVQNASFPVIAGSVWFGNSTGSLSVFDLTGVALTGTGGFTGGGVGSFAGPLGLAFDSSGKMWVASSSGVSEFTRQGGAVSSTPNTSGGIRSAGGCGGWRWAGVGRQREWHGERAEQCGRGGVARERLLRPGQHAGGHCD